MINETLDEASNYLGKLSPAIRARFQAFFADPTEANWDAIHAIVINPGSMRRATIWQMVVCIDPNFPIARAIGGWYQVPTVFTVMRALREAVRK